MASLKYGGLFDDEPAAAVPSSKGKGSAYSSLFGDDPRNPKKQVKKYPGLFDDDTGAADVANCTVPAASRKAAVPAKDLFVDDGDMTVSAAAMIASARGRSQIPPSPTANTKPSQLIPVDDPAAIEDDESMFELKYYEERARRMRLETRIAELENTVLALMAQLEVKSGGSALAAVTPIAEELEAVGAKLGVADHNEEALAATGDADPHATALILEDGRQRRQAEQERRQRQQRRSASTSARRLHGRTVVAGSGEGPVGTAALEAMPTETISSILSWSSDDDVPEPAAFKSCASLGNGNNVDAAIPSVEETSAEGPSQFDTCGAADEATYRRRQKAYRGAMGARPTSRRLGANRLGSRQQQTGKGAGGATTSQHSDNAKRKSSLGGFEKWSDSEESTGSVHCKDQSSGHRDKRAESLHWDSEIEDAGVYM